MSIVFASLNGERDLHMVKRLLRYNSAGLPILIAYCTNVDFRLLSPIYLINSLIIRYLNVVIMI